MFFPLTISGITMLWCIVDSFMLNKLSHVILLIFSASIAFIRYPFLLFFLPPSPITLMFSNILDFTSDSVFFRKSWISAIFDRFLSFRTLRSCTEDPSVLNL